MVTTTIHSDEDFAAALREYAARAGVSVNQAVKELLAPALGLVRPKENPYEAFCGILPHDDAEKLRRRLDGLRTIDAEMWK